MGILYQDPSCYNYYVEVITNKDLIEKFLTRGVANIYPSADLLRKALMSGRRLRVYQGFDPTGKFLHIGHAMGIRSLRILQQLGHDVIFLVGDFTSKIGDPDKTTSREMLTDEKIQQNMSSWKEQASQLIEFDGENPVTFKNNFEWLSKVSLEKMLELMSHTTLQQMIERDLFDRRLKENDPIKLHEIVYPIMQGFDSVAMEVDLELGGTDQIFNMMVGRTLVKDYLGKEKFVRAHEMMEAPDATTMSKTKGNGINLGDTSEDIYGKAMSYPDELIVKGLKLLTDVPLDVISEIDLDIQTGKDQLKHKKLMAYEIVKVIRGENEAKKAQDFFERTVQNKELDDSVVISVPLKGKMTLVDFVRQIKTDLSASDIKRTIQQGGAEVNGDRKVDITEEINFKQGDVIKFGKRNYFKID